MQAITSLELHYLLRNINKELAGARIENIYQPAKKDFYIQFHISGKGKQILRLVPGNALFLTTRKPSMAAPKSFCMQLRKLLLGSRLKEVKQLGFERIVEFVLVGKEEISLIVELFSKGNLLLCKKGEIIALLERQKWAGRELKQGLEYDYPKGKYNFLKLTKQELGKMLKDTKMSTLVKALAVEFGLGGKHAEKLCSFVKIDKNAKPGEISDFDKLFSAVKHLRTEALSPDLINKELEKQYLVVKAKDKVFLEKLAKLENIVKKQKEQLIILERETKENQEKAELIYTNYKLVKSILDEIKKAREKYSWKDIKSKLKGHKLVKEINEKQGKITVEL